MQTNLVLVRGFPELAAVLTPLRFSGPHDLMELPSVVVLADLSVVDACALTAGTTSARSPARRWPGGRRATGTRLRRVRRTCLRASGMATSGRRGS